MSVTYNLFCFLRRLLSATRRPLCDIRDMPLWIDQLCINQSDDSEKAVQVAMMDRVYNQAERVVSWLGESDSSIEAATKLLRRLSDVQLSQVSQADFDVARFVKDIPREEWFGLGSLLSRPYFKRAWIVQEIAMAKQLLVVCGQHILRWEDLVHCSSIIETTGAWKMLSQYAELFRPVQDHISPDARHCQLFRYGGLVDASNFMDIIDNGHLDSGIAKAYEDRRSQEKEEGKYEWRRSKFDEAFRRIRDVCQNEREGNEQGEENVFPDPQWRKFKKLEAPLFHDEPADLVEQRQELKYRADRFAAAIGMKLDSRRLFYTANGSLGMGPESLQEEDEIWEIDGLQALAVVRKMDSGVYRFVGEAFVLGLMRSQNRDPASLSQLVDVVLK
ncbi:hypothetical protein VTH82DRAFT_2386 [Thermothelomyces myriococcoides]